MHTIPNSGFQIDGLSNTYFLLFTKKKKIPSIFMVDFPATPLKIHMEPEHHPVSKRESHKVQSPYQPIFWVPDVSFFPDGTVLLEVRINDPCFGSLHNEPLTF